MIVSVSRRTDIPNYYADWFLTRVKEGFACVRNPMNPRQISKVALSPEVVDCFVFWTKNPANMLDRLGELQNYDYYFQFTLTGYGKDVEPGLPDKRTVLLPTFQRLSREIGKERVIWRYDPILLSERYTKEYHLKAFEEIADRLAGYTEKVVISFVDFYAKTRRNAADLHMRQITGEEIYGLAGELARIAKERHLTIETCAEEMDLQELGIGHGCCIDQRLIERITGCSIQGKKDKNQRKECGCFESIEIGAYNTCKTGCKYCYANFSMEKVKQSCHCYDPVSPLLCGTIGAEDVVMERQMKSLKDGQMRLW